jgi:hypothetical protein
VPPQGLLVGSLGVGDLTQVPDDLPQPRWVQPPRGLQQHRLRLCHRLAGQVLGGADQRRGVRVADVPIGQRLGGAGQGAAVQGSGDADAVVGVGVAHAGPVPQPGGGGLDRGAVVGAGGAAAVHPGQVPQPDAFQPLDEPMEHQHPLGRFGVGVFGGQLVDCGGQQARPAGPFHRMCVRLHGRNLSHPIPNTRSDRQIVDDFLA